MAFDQDYQPTVQVSNYYANTPPRRMKGQNRSIIGAFCVVTFPLLVINIVLIAILVKCAEPGSLARLKSL